MVLLKYIIHDYQNNVNYNFWTRDKPNGFIYSNLIKNYHIGLLTLMIRKDYYHFVNGFDKRFHVIGDFDISLRLAKHFKVVSLNQVTAHYRNLKQQKQIRIEI